MAEFEGSVYNLFHRNWVNRKAEESHLDQAIAKGFITEAEKSRIMEAERISI